MSLQSPITPQPGSFTAPVPPSNPSLPQQDTPAVRAEREAQLAQSCTRYVWDTAVPTLPGVPLAAAVPADNLPTLA
jgi:arachidonate 15-lipoxygenase